MTGGERHGSNWRARGHLCETRSSVHVVSARQGLASIREKKNFKSHPSGALREKHGKAPVADHHKEREKKKEGGDSPLEERGPAGSSGSRSWLVYCPKKKNAMGTVRHRAGRGGGKKRV